MDPVGHSKIRRKKQFKEFNSIKIIRKLIKIYDL